MKAEEQDYKQMPLRSRNRSDGTFKKVNTQNFVSNFYHVTIDPSLTSIYQYDYKLYDQVSNIIEYDSQLYREFLKQAKIQAQESLGLEMAKGQIAYCRKDRPITNIKCEIKIRKTKKKIEKGEGLQQGQLTALKLQGVFKKVKEINIKNLLALEGSDRAVIFQMLNINLKQKLRDSGMQEMGRTSKYFEKDPRILEVKNEFKGKVSLELKVIPGFKMSLLEFNKRFVLQVDSCFRVLQAINLRDYFLKQIRENKLPRDQINKECIDQTVTCMYGNFKNYKIKKIHFDKNPLSKFVLEIGAEITYKDYYLKNYNIAIEDLKQPLVQVPKPIDKKISKDQKLEATDQTIFLIPELICLAGLNPTQEQNRYLMKELGKITKMTPNSRMQRCNNAVKNLSKQTNIMRISQQETKVPGYILNRPSLYYCNKKQIIPDGKGTVSHRGRLLKSMKFEQCLLVYSDGHKSDTELADEVSRYLKDASKTYGIEFNKIIKFSVPHNWTAQDWIKQIEADCDENGNPDIIIFLLGKKERTYYSELKQAAVNYLKCPSQCIEKKTFDTDNHRAKMSAASKLAIQMSVKAGCPAWEVNREHVYFRGKKMMYCGITTSKGKNGTFLSFVGTVNNTCTQFLSNCTKVQSHLNIPKALFQKIFIDWLKKFKEVEKELPDVILIYREGLNEVQANNSIENIDVAALKEAIKTAGEKCNIKGYRPSWQLITVNKKINSRFFKMIEDLSLQNPESGSFVTEDMETSCSFDLAPQYVSQGTLTPTRFCMHSDNSDISKQAVIMFTYEQSFNYYNWEGAVRVPGCLQYANKLGMLRSEHFKQEIDNKLTNSLFYL